jgi:predicted ATPase
MLVHMERTKLLQYDFEREVWRWDLQGIAALNIYDDVVDIALEELQTSIFLSLGN